MAFLCHFDKFSDDTSYEQVNKYGHGWWRKNEFQVVNMWSNIVMDDWNLDEKIAW